MDRRKSRLSAMDQESVQYATNQKEILFNMDPLGISQGGNLPEIAEAFRVTGNVCVERTLRILNKSKGRDLFTSNQH